MKNTSIDEIKKKINIVDVISNYLDLSKKGKNYWAVCPFHEDTSPSMSISQDRQLYKCFTCNHGGDVFNFVKDFKKIPYKEAVAEVAKTIGVDFQYKNTSLYSEEEHKMINMLVDVNVFFEYNLHNAPDNVLEFLNKRKLTKDICSKFNIGFSPKDFPLINYISKKGYDEAQAINLSIISDNKKNFFKDRVIFSIKNYHGDIVGFSGRALNDVKPKYINSGASKIFQKNNLLYNWSNAIFSIQKSKQVYIVEGFMDVIAFYKAGIENVVAIMGTSLTDRHAKYLKDKEVIFMLDSDKAGINATIKSIRLLQAFNIKSFVVENDTGKDPDEILNDHSKAKLIEVINSKKDSLEFIWDMHIAEFNLSSPSSIDKFVNSFSKYLFKTSKIIQSFYDNKFEEKTGIKNAFINKEVLQNNATRNYNATKSYDETNMRHQINFNSHKVKEQEFSLIETILLSLQLNPDFIEKYKKYIHSEGFIYLDDGIYTSIILHIIHKKPLDKNMQVVWDRLLKIKDKLVDPEEKQIPMTEDDFMHCIEKAKIKWKKNKNIKN